MLDKLKQLNGSSIKAPTSMVKIEMAILLFTELHFSAIWK